MGNKNLYGKCLVAVVASAMASLAGAQAPDEPIKPLPLKLTFDARKVELGKALFHDKRLSKDNSISCASCHDLAKGGADGKPTAVGIGGQVGPINTPTVLNYRANDMFNSEFLNPGKVRIVVAPTLGKVVVQDQGTPEDYDDRFLYTPNPNTHGDDRFQYEYC